MGKLETLHQQAFLLLLIIKVQHFPGGSAVNRPMQEIQVQSLIQEDPTRHGATKPAHRSRDQSVL